MSYQRYFYDIVAKRLEFELPRSFTDEEGSEEETKMAVNAINLSIIGMVD